MGRKIDDDKARDPDLMTENLKNDIMKPMLEKGLGGVGRSNSIPNLDH